MIEWIYDLSLMPEDRNTTILISYMDMGNELQVTTAKHYHGDIWGDPIYSEWDIPKSDIIAFAFINYPVTSDNYTEMN